MNILLSIRPIWSGEIVTGNKTVELRKIFSKKEISKIFFYETASQKLIRFYVENPVILRDTPDRLWSKVKDRCCIPYNQYCNYYKNSKEAVGIFFDKINWIEKTTPDMIRINTGWDFKAPQNFCYLKDKVIDYLLREKK